MHRIIGFAILAALFALAPESRGAVIYSTPASTYSQNFDSLPNTPENATLGNIRSVGPMTTLLLPLAISASWARIFITQLHKQKAVLAENNVCELVPALRIPALS